MDYIVKFVTGDPVWNNGAEGVPVDVFVVIEMMCKNRSKGNTAAGSAVNTLAKLTQAMNDSVTARGLQNQFVYESVPLMNIRNRETMGVIYNSVKLSKTDQNVLRNRDGKLLNPSTPFWTRFVLKALPNTPINIIGIHAPTKLRNTYDHPLAYVDALATIPEIIQQTETVVITGDYNCSPCAERTTQVVTGNKRQRVLGYGFQDIITLNYTTQLPNPMFQDAPPPEIYSTIRHNVNNDYPWPFNYLSEAYDNSLYHSAEGTVAQQAVNNLIVTARNTGAPFMQGTTMVPNGLLYPDRLGYLLAQYQKITEHFPVTTIH
ncbi:MAG: hypothetical protein ACRC3B_14350 [Bacteroidia bacterium]